MWQMHKGHNPDVLRYSCSHCQQVHVNVCFKTPEDFYGFSQKILNLLSAMDIFIYLFIYFSNVQTVSKQKKKCGHICVLKAIALILTLKYVRQSNFICVAHFIQKVHVMHTRTKKSKGKDFFFLNPEDVYKRKLISSIFQ